MSEQSTAEDTDDTFAIDATGDTRLPLVEFLRGRGFVTGKSGSGKSNSVSVIAEELLKRSHPLLIVDTDGEYYGLKEEFELLHAGADEECDIRVGPEHAEKLVTLALEQHVPIILDVSGYLDEDTARELIFEVAQHLFAKEKQLRRPFPFIVEEIHEYVPQSGGLDDLGRMLIQITKRGRKHGLGIIGVSQRPADVSKGFITQCKWMLWHRLTWDNDTKVVRSVIDREHADAVAGLNDGEGFLMADWADDILRVQFRRKETFDAGATPGLEDIEQPDLKSVSDALVDELQEISDEQDRYESELEQVEREAKQLRAEKEEMEDQLRTAREVNVQLEGATASIADTPGDSAAASDVPPAVIDEETGTSEVASIESINVEAMDVGEIRQRAQNQAHLIEDLRDENEHLHERVEDLTERAEQAEQTVAEQRERIAELEEYERLYDHRDELAEAIRRAGEALGIDFSGDAEQYREQLRTERERVEELEATVEQLETTADSQSKNQSDELAVARAENDALREQVDELEGEVEYLREQESFVDEHFAEKMDFVRTDAVREQIERAAEKTRTKPTHTWDAVFYLADAEDPVTVDQVVPTMEVGTSSVRDILKELANQNIVFTRRQGKKKAYQLNLAGMETIISQQRRREEMDNLREDVGVQDAQL